MIIYKVDFRNALGNALKITTGVNRTSKADWPFKRVRTTNMRLNAWS